MQQCPVLLLHILILLSFPSAAVSYPSQPGLFRLSKHQHSIIIELPFQLCCVRRQRFDEKQATQGPLHVNHPV